MHTVVDTCVLIDRADEHDTTIEAIEILTGKLKVGRIGVPPTVVQELNHFASNFPETEAGQLSEIALDNMLDWGFEPFNLVNVGHGITEQIAYKLIQEGFLPEREFNDGLIVAEAALFECKLLISADAHMLGIQDHKGDEGFKRFLAEQSVIQFVISSPKALVRSMGEWAGGVNS